jgi:DNA invertase Pin-like site-specific DNA recombinase
MQERELRAYAASKEWTITHVFHEQQSGTKDTRPKLAEIMRLATQREIDIILVWKLDRFARSVRHTVVLWGELEAVGVKFVSMLDNLDFTTAQGRFMAHILAIFAEFEASMIRDRVRAGLRAARAKGKTLGAPRRIDRQAVFAYAAEGLRPSQIGRIVGASRSAVRKILACPHD